MQDTLLTACPEAKTQNWLRSIPACMPAPAGPNPKAWAGPDAADGGVGASPDMDTGGSTLVMGTGAGPWAAWATAGVERGVVISRSA